MHPDMTQLAAYLDAALDEAERARLRAHILTCPACTAKIEQLRADARLITTTLASSGPVPDVRSALRARRRRDAPLARLARGGLFVGAFAGAFAALLLFAVLLGSRNGGTLGRVPDRLFVTDRSGGQLVALDAADGARLGSVAVGRSPTQVFYDRSRDRLYVLLAGGVAAVEPESLEVVALWEAGPEFRTSGRMVLDERRERLYIAWPDAGRISALDTATLAPVAPAPDGRMWLADARAPGPLALAPDGRRLFAVDGADGRLWTFDLATGSGTAQSLGHDLIVRPDELAIGADGRSLFILHDVPGDDAANPPELRRLDLRDGTLGAPVVLDAGPTAWEVLLIDAGYLAIPRGNMVIGGVEIVDAASLTVTARIDPDYDQHHLAAGPAGSLFALNYTHRTVTRYNLDTGAVTWRTPGNADWQPWNGAFVQGGWRWPW